MFQLINSILADFRGCFKREKTWRWFVVLVLGLMMRPDHRGVTSVISALRLEPSLYENSLRFFRSNAYVLDDIWRQWIRTASRYRAKTPVGERLVLAGDHIKIPKQARRQPDIEVMHQEAGSSGKPEYACGHIFGHIGSIIGSGKDWRLMPLHTQMHVSSTNGGDGSLVAQMLKQAVKVVTTLGEPALILLDAYFCSKTVWEIIGKCVDEVNKRFLEVIIRCKMGSVAYEAPKPPTTPKRGRPRIYGDKVVLRDLFNDLSQFTETTVDLYGKPTKLLYRCLDLIWKPVKQLVRFVLVHNADGTNCIFMCSDLSVAPEEIIFLYSLRFKIEDSFGEQKNDLGTFGYRFWTLAMTLRLWFEGAHVPEDANPHQLHLIAKARQAIEAFVCLGTIAAGILTLCAFHHGGEVWALFPGWLRTVRSPIPTIATAKLALAANFHSILPDLAHLASFSFIQPLIRRIPFLYRSA